MLSVVFVMYRVADSVDNFNAAAVLADPQIARVDMSVAVIDTDTGYFQLHVVTADADHCGHFIFLHCPDNAGAVWWLFPF
jgi:hypothetical protein